MKFMTWRESKDAWSEAFSPHVKKVTGIPSWLWNKPIAFPKATQSLSETFSAEGYQKGGAFIRETAISRISGFGKGMVYGTSKPDGEESSWDKFKNMLDAGAGFVDAGTKRIEDPFGGWSFQDWLNEQTAKIPKPKDIIPEGGLVQIPTPDLTPVKEGMDNFAMALAMGLGSLGQGIGGGLPQMPEMPSMQLMNEEGQPNILMLGGLAAVAYVVLKGRGK